MLVWTKALNERIQSDHGASHGFAGGIGIKAAVNGMPLVKECSQPARVGSGTGCGDATVLGVESKATDRIDGRLHQNNGRQRDSGNREKATIFLGTRSQTTPGARGGAPQFGADGVVFLSKQKEDGIGSLVSVEVTRSMSAAE